MVIHLPRWEAGNRFFSHSPQREPTLPVNSLTSDSSLQICETINFCWTYNPTCETLTTAVKTNRVFTILKIYLGFTLMAQMVKNLYTMQETRIWSLVWEDPLEKRIANHHSILAWKIPWTEEAGELQSMESQRGRHNWGTNIFYPLMKSGKTIHWMPTLSTSLGSDSWGIGTAVELHCENCISYLFFKFELDHFEVFVCLFCFVFHIVTS